MIKEYLNFRLTNNKLYHSLLIQTSEIDKTLADLKDFVKNSLMNNNLDFSSNHNLKLISEESFNNKAAGVISLEKIKELREFLYKTSSSYKVIIIYKADLMSTYAANACLKILEEPPSKSLIFLLTSKLYAIQPTIKSRCVVLNDNKNLKTECSSTIYLKSISHLLKDNNKLFMKEFLEFDSKLWEDFSNSVLLLIVKIIKKSVGYNVKLSEIEIKIIAQLDIMQVSHLIKKYEQIKSIIDDTNNFNLDPKASYLLLMYNFNKLKHF